MTNDRVGISIVGGGRIADLNVLGYIEHPAADLVAICDVNDATRSRRAEEWGCTAYTKLDELLEDERVDAIDILTPHHLHAEQAIVALRAGKHVSLQKPPTTTIADFDRVASAAREAGVIFRVYENFMYYPPHVRARELVQDGVIGDVLSVRILTAGGRLDSGWDVPAASNAWRMDPALCGGGMMTFDHGFHCFQLGRMFVTEPVEVVHAFINTIDLGGGREIDAPALVSWRYEASGGAMPKLGSWELVPSINLDVRSDYYVSDDRLEIRGTSGIIWVNRCSGQLLEEPALCWYRDGVVTADHRIEHDWAASFRAATSAFVDSILDGTPVALDAAEARETLAFALAAQRSASEAREVTVSEVRDSHI